MFTNCCKYFSGSNIIFAAVSYGALRNQSGGIAESAGPYPLRYYRLINFLNGEFLQLDNLFVIA